MKKSQISKLLREFSALYPDPKTELDFKNQYQLLLAVMLSAQCTDKKVNQVSPTLFQRFPSFKELSGASLAELETIIRPINYYKTKSKHLIETAKQVVKNFKSRVPRTHEDLISLPGVGRKTANVILSELGIAPAFPVDTHVFRVSKRLGLASADKHDKVEDELKEIFDEEHWRPLHHWLILHGRRVCKAQRPLCEECTISNICPSS